MEYRYLGASGLKVSALSFGSWVTFGNQMNIDKAYDCMQAAYEAGVNFFDNAEVYADGQSEEIMGRVIKKAGWKRSDLVISTKIFWGGDGPNDRGLSRKHILEGTEASLKRLQLDYVDLIYCHRPDQHTPIEETVRAMNQVIQQGKAFYWGTSEWSAQQIQEAITIAQREHLIAPTMEQPEYNMLQRERVEKEYAPLYARYGLGTTIWSPLASGLLTGKYNNGIPEGSRMSVEGYDWLRKKLESPEGQQRLVKVRQLTDLAKELNMPMAGMALAWCLKNPQVSTVITGASGVEQVEQNMAALSYVDQLDQSVMQQIEVILENRPEVAQDFR